MAKATSITVDVKMSIPDETISRCLRILEIWMDDNPHKRILVDRLPTKNGYRHIIYVKENADA